MKTLFKLIVTLLIAILVCIAGGYIGLKITGNEDKIAEITSYINNLLSFGYKNTIITAENYNDMIEKMNEEIENENEILYASYAMLYYITQDGIGEAFSSLEKESYNEQKMYKRIYGKTINQLISEGKELMRENDMTLEKYKQNLNELSEE